MATLVKSVEIGVRVTALFIGAPLLGVERTIPKLIIIGRKKGERRPSK
ncbi:hypothetical protein COO91_07969 [Nostoc flagelliforme CCNUN1]|uniref:Uncharacterized protein n=1 Tax=Nostoc flagelliforme CCNUN1 TaxID=2038116 RepID=A0A2K8T2I3_9NOSO|nr:hypothetical protein COO91_07969 [Nostoc flagelliforme CCNUN1]